MSRGGVTLGCTCARVLLHSVWADDDGHLRGEFLTCPWGLLLILEDPGVSTPGGMGGGRSCLADVLPMGPYP